MSNIFKFDLVVVPSSANHPNICGSKPVHNIFFYISLSNKMKFRACSIVLTAVPNESG